MALKSFLHTLVLLKAINNSCFPQRAVFIKQLGYCVMGGLQGCVMRGFSRNSTMVASHLMVVLLATERFIALRFPFCYQQLMLPKRVIIVAVSLYLYAVCCLALLKLYKNETNRYWKILKNHGFYADHFQTSEYLTGCNVS